jgi:hypothetical protein
MDQKVLNATISFFEEQATLYLAHARVLKEFLQPESPITTKKNSKAKGAEKNVNSAPPEEKGGKPKQKKAAQNGPKRALSGYQLFVQEKYKSCKEENPAINSKELFSMLSKEWKSLEEGKKAAFLHKAEQLKLPVNSLVAESVLVLPISETEHHDIVEVEKNTIHHDASDPDKKKKKKKKKHSHENDEAEDSEHHNKERKKVW